MVANILCALCTQMLNSPPQNIIIFLHLLGVEIGVANKNAVLRCSWALSNDLKHNEASFSTISTVWLHLRAAYVPRSRDLAIFVLINGQADRQN